MTGPPDLFVCKAHFHEFKDQWMFKSIKDMNGVELINRDDDWPEIIE